MTVLKDVLCLLAIFVAYGITGRLDYEDALRTEQIRQERQHADHLPVSPPSTRQALAQIDKPFVDPHVRLAISVSPEVGQPCAPRLAVGRLPC